MDANQAARRTKRAENERVAISIVIRFARRTEGEQVPVAIRDQYRISRITLTSPKDRQVQLPVQPQVSLRRGWLTLAHHPWLAFDGRILKRRQRGIIGRHFDEWKPQRREMRRRRMRTPDEKQYHETNNAKPHFAQQCDAV
jgi:hypothetical protein